MRLNRLILLVIFCLVAACGGPAPSSSSEVHTWKQVEDLEATWKNATAANADAAKQQWADALHAYVVAHPQDENAGKKWDALALEFARSLAAQGRYRAAVPYYEAVIERNPDDETVAGELAEARERLAMTSATLGAIAKGMTRDEVREKVGPPQPGWSKIVREGDHPIEAWYYPREDGGTVSIHFVDGKVFDIETGG